MNLLPIIPGCDAVITSGIFSGREVRVLYFIGEHKCFTAKDWWEIEPLPDCPVKKYWPMVRDVHLMRIDGGEFEEEKELVEIEV